MKYFFLFLLPLCLYGQTKSNLDSLTICHPTISDDNFQKLQREWRRNPITKGYHLTDLRMQEGSYSKDSTILVWTLCPHIAVEAREIGLYIFASYFQFHQRNQTIIDKNYKLYSVRMHLPILCFEDKMIITHDIAEKKAVLADFCSKYKTFFNKKELENLQKMYLKTVFDPRMPDFPKRTNGILPVNEGINSHLDSLLKKDGKQVKLQKIYNKEYETNYHLYKFLGFYRSAFFSKCDSCFFYSFSPVVSSLVNNKLLGLYKYIEFEEPGEVEWYRYYYVLVFPNKVIISPNIFIKWWYMKRFLIMYGKYFTKEQREELKKRGLMRGESIYSHFK